VQASFAQCFQLTYSLRDTNWTPIVAWLQAIVGSMLAEVLPSVFAQTKLNEALVRLVGRVYFITVRSCLILSVVCGASEAM
jgi:hypothetical protein